MDRNSTLTPALYDYWRDGTQFCDLTEDQLIALTGEWLLEGADGDSVEYVYGALAESKEWPFPLMLAMAGRPNPNDDVMRAMNLAVVKMCKESLEQRWHEQFAEFAADAHREAS